MCECRKLKAPPEEVPFLMAWQFWAVVTVAILVLAGTIYFLKKGVTSATYIRRLVPSRNVVK